LAASNIETIIEGGPINDRSDIAELGTQSVVSELLAGKRKLNLRQIRFLVGRFSVPAEVFI
jgi:HTH-type transcriptional regulator/antitoxin HigA